jgi:two-component system, OmpR family, phosphate regulon sensor histidine kinase PhoR
MNNENNRIKILIVEDEKGVRLGTKRLLEREGYYVETAEDGLDGISLGTSAEFDIAVVDLKIPGCDGIQVIQQINKKFPNTICYIATAFASYESAVEAAKIGAFGYITKPFSPEELISNIKKGYERRSLLVETEKWKREREERLLEVAFEKSRLNTIINSISDGILVVNRKGEAVLYNPSALKYLELDEIRLEENILNKINNEIASQVNLILEEETLVRKSYSVQMYLQKDKEIYIEATLSPVPHPNGTLAGVAVVLKNISELKKMEIFRAQFVSMVSHELKAPIAAVKGYLDLLAGGTIPLSEEKKKQFVKRSVIRLESLLNLVDDLLDVSRMEKKVLHKDLREIDIKEIFQNILELFNLELKKRKLKVSLNINKGLPPVLADYEEFYRLFTNLISNAIKYNKDEGSLSVNASSSNDYILIEIADTGIGLKENEKERLFTEFFRAKNELTENISGTGLGLAIIKRIIDSYAAKIEVISEFKKGTTFKIYWPIKKEVEKVIHTNQ